MKKMVQTSRLIYNDSVTKLNRELHIFPTSVLAHMLGFEKRDYLVEKLAEKEMQRMNKLHRSRYINVVVSMMMAFLMLAAMGTTQVHAAQYTTGTIDPCRIESWRCSLQGVQLTVDRQIVVCKKVQYDMDYDGHGLRYWRRETL